MSSISGIDSNSSLNTLLSYLNKTANSSSSSETDSSGTAASQTTPDSTTVSINSLLEQMKISLLQNQSSFMTSLFSIDDASSSDSSGSLDPLSSILGKAETDKINNAEATDTQLAQLINVLNSSSSSSASDDTIENLLQSLGGSDTSQSNSELIQTVLAYLLKSTGSASNSSAQGILDQYLSPSADKSSLIKTVV
jgi:hypothetical protein